MLHFLFFPWKHLVLSIYLVGIVVTWFVTHVSDGYRRERGYGSSRDDVERAMTCVFWPLVFLFQRLVNIAEFLTNAYDRMIDGLRAFGAWLGKL